MRPGTAIFHRSIWPGYSYLLFDTTFFYTLYNQISMEVHVVCLAMCFGTYMYMYMLLLFCVFSISHPSAIETLVFLLIASLVHYYHSNSSHVLTM
jgi:hypothetical protein